MILALTTSFDSLFIISRRLLILFVTSFVLLENLSIKFAMVPRSLFLYTCSITFCLSGSGLRLCNYFV